MFAKQSNLVFSLFVVFVGVFALMTSVQAAYGAAVFNTMFKANMDNANQQYQAALNEKSNSYRAASAAADAATDWSRAASNARAATKITTNKQAMIAEAMNAENDALNALRAANQGVFNPGADKRTADWAWAQKAITAAANVKAAADRSAAAWMKATIAEGKTTNNGAFWNGGSSGIFNHANNRDWDEGSICAGKHLFVNGHIGQRNYPTAAMSCVWDTNTKNCLCPDEVTCQDGNGGDYRAKDGQILTIPNHQIRRCCHYYNLAEDATFNYLTTGNHQVMSGNTWLDPRGCPWGYDPIIGSSLNLSGSPINDDGHPQAFCCATGSGPFFGNY